MPYRFLVFLLLSLPFTPRQAPAADLTYLERQALKAFSQAIEYSDRATYSTAILQRLATQRGTDPQALRDQLLEALDLFDEALQQHKKDKTPLWQDVMARRGELSSKRAYKLLEHTAAGVRTMLQSPDKYLIEFNVRQAARRAKLTEEEAVPFLLKSLDLLASYGEDEGTVRQYGLLVSGHTNRFEINKDPLYLFFNTQDEAFVLEEVREIQRFIIPRVVRQATDAPTVKYAVRLREKTALVRPEFHLVIGVDNLYFTGSNVDLRPCVEATLQLLRLPQEEAVATRQLQYCTEASGSKNAEDLHPFYDEVAAEAVRQLNEELSLQR